MNKYFVIKYHYYDHGSKVVVDNDFPSIDISVLPRYLVIGIRVCMVNSHKSYADGELIDMVNYRRNIYHREVFIWVGQLIDKSEVDKYNYNNNEFIWCKSECKNGTYDGVVKSISGTWYGKEKNHYVILHLGKLKELEIDWSKVKPITQKESNNV